MIYEVKGDKNSGVYFGQASSRWSFKAKVDQANKLVYLNLFDNDAGYSMASGWWNVERQQRRFALESLREYRGKPVVTAA